MANGLEPGLVNPLLILLVEDDDAIRGVMERVLTKLGHTVLSFSSCSGPEEVEGPFDAAVVDLNLGGREGDGYELILRLKARCPDAVFILMSGSRPALPSPDSGGPFFLRKPFSRGELVALLDRAQPL